MAGGARDSEGNSHVDCKADSDDKSSSGDGRGQETSEAAVVLEVVDFMAWSTDLIAEIAATTQSEKEGLEAIRSAPRIWWWLGHGDDVRLPDGDRAILRE